MPPQDVTATDSDMVVGSSSVKNVASLYTHDDVTSNEELDVATILQALTDDEIARMPDDHMPLRHLRAEKVRIPERPAQCVYNRWGRSRRFPVSGSHF
jgi:hypothetical protein